MNKIHIGIVLVIIFSLLNCVYAQSYNYKNEDTNYDLVIEDDAELLTEAQIDRLAGKMIPLTTYGNIIFKSIDSNDSTSGTYASKYYHNKYGSQSGTIFLIDMDNREIYIFSDGNFFKTITKSKAEIITDNVYKYAGDKEYYTCAAKVYEQMVTLFEGGKIAEPMKYASNVLVAMVCAFLFNFIAIMIMSRIKKANASDVLKNCDIDFKINDVSARKVGEHRVYSPRSSGSSSGGGHSSGGGGHSSGGGGGHRF